MSLTKHISTPNFEFDLPDLLDLPILPDDSGIRAIFAILNAGTETSSPHKDQTEQPSASDLKNQQPTPRPQRKAALQANELLSALAASETFDSASSSDSETTKETASRKRTKTAPSTRAAKQHHASAPQPAPHKDGNNSGPWTEDETQRLQVAHQQYGTQWHLISQAVGTRKPSQCLHRIRALEPRCHEKWSKAEDDSLREIRNQPTLKWSEIAHQLAQRKLTQLPRSAAQCLERWANKLDPELKGGSWTQEENKHLLKIYKAFYAQGKSNAWAKMARAFGSSRTDFQVRKQIAVLLKNNQSQPFL
ncbi:MAG: Myb-like DNA-binding domain-containing protein [Candidatus Margulisiibacteriota bacterium]